MFFMYVAGQKENADKENFKGYPFKALEMLQGRKSYPRIINRNHCVLQRKALLKRKGYMKK